LKIGSKTGSKTGARTVPKPVLPSTPAREESMYVDPWKHHSLHPLDQILSDINTGVQTRSKLKNCCAFYAFLSTIEPKNINEARADSDWVTTMQEELHKFKRNKVCHLVSQPEDRLTIDTKWVFKNKLDKLITVPKNETKLVQR